MINLRPDRTNKEKTESSLPLTKPKKDPRMKAWKGLWLQYNMAKGKQNPLAAKTYAQELAILGHQLLPTGFVKFIPIFLELSG